MREALGALTATKVTEGKQAGGGQIEQQQREIQAAVRESKYKLLVLSM